MAKKSSSGKIAAGLGVAALAAGAAAAYYLSSSEGKKARAKVKHWSSQAKTELAGRLKQMKSVSQKAYEGAAKQVLAKYKTAKNIEPAELVSFGNELKGHWEQIAKATAKLGNSNKKKPAKKAQAKK